MADPNDITQLGPLGGYGIPAPRAETSYLGDLWRAGKAGTFAVLADLAGFGDVMFEDDGWAQRTSNDLEKYFRSVAQDTQSRMDPDRARRQGASFFGAEGKPDFWQQTGSEMLGSIGLKLAGMFGSTAPSIVGGVVGGPAGFAAGTITEAGGTGGNIAKDLERYIMSLPADELAKKYPRYEIAIAHGMSDHEARRLVYKNDAAKDAMAGVLAATGLGLIGAGGGKAVTAGVGSRILRHGTVEAGQEWGQQLGQQLAQWGTGAGIGPKNWRETADEWLESALGGFAMGGGAGLLHPRVVTTTGGNAPSPAQTLGIQTSTGQTPPPPPNQTWPGNVPPIPPAAPPNQTWPGGAVPPPGAPPPPPPPNMPPGWSGSQYYGPTPPPGAPPRPTPGVSPLPPSPPPGGPTPSPPPGMPPGWSGSAYFPPRPQQPPGFGIPEPGRPAVDLSLGWGTPLPQAQPRAAQPAVDEGWGGGPPAAPVPAAPVPPTSPFGIPERPVIGSGTSTPPGGALGSIPSGGGPAATPEAGYRAMMQQRLQSLFGSLPPPIQQHLIQLSERLRSTAHPMERARIAQDIQSTLAMAGLDQGVLARLMAQPTAEQPGAVGPARQPGPMAPVATPWGTAQRGQPAQQVPAGGGAVERLAIPEPPMASVPGRPATIPQLAQETLPVGTQKARPAPAPVERKARGRMMRTGQHVGEALREAYAAARTNQLAGVTINRPLTAFFDNIVRRVLAKSSEEYRAETERLTQQDREAGRMGLSKSKQTVRQLRQKHVIEAIMDFAAVNPGGVIGRDRQGREVTIGHLAEALVQQIRGTQIGAGSTKAQNIGRMRSAGITEKGVGKQQAIAAHPVTHRALSQRLLQRITQKVAGGLQRAAQSFIKMPLSRELGDPERARATAQMRRTVDRIRNVLGVKAAMGSQIDVLDELRTFVNSYMHWLDRRQETGLGRAVLERVSDAALAIENLRADLTESTPKTGPQNRADVMRQVLGTLYAVSAIENAQGRPFVPQIATLFEQALNLRREDNLGAFLRAIDQVYKVPELQFQKIVPQRHIPGENVEGDEGVELTREERVTERQRKEGQPAKPRRGRKVKELAEGVVADVQGEQRPQGTPAPRDVTADLQRVERIEVEARKKREEERQKKKEAQAAARKGAKAKLRKKAKPESAPDQVSVSPSETTREARQDEVRSDPNAAPVPEPVTQETADAVAAVREEAGDADTTTAAGPAPQAGEAGRPVSGRPVGRAAGPRQPRGAAGGDAAAGGAAQPKPRVARKAQQRGRRVLINNPNKSPLKTFNEDQLPDVPDSVLAQVAALAKEWMDKTANAVTLRMHQMVGIARTLQARASNIRNFALHDGTGTGKTLQEIAVAVHVARATGKPSLIITQDKLPEVFNAEIARLGLTGNDKPHIYTYTQLGDGAVPKRQWGAIVYDEAHALKNIRSQRTTQATELERAADKPFIMRASGTLFDDLLGAAHTLAVMTNRDMNEVARELGFRILSYETKKGEWAYEYRLLPGVQKEQVIDRIAVAHHQLLRAGAMLRRQFDFWGKVHEVEVPGVDPAAFRAEEQAIAAAFPPTRAGGGGRLQALRDAAELAKLPYVIEEIRKALAAGKQVIVVGERVADINIPGRATVNSALEQLSLMIDSGSFTDRDGNSVSAARLYGNRRNTTIEMRKFQNGTAKVALITPKSGGTGIDLDDQSEGGKAPRLMLMMTQNYAGDTFEQVLGRISRMQTTSAAEIRLLNIPGSVADAHADKVLGPKLNVLAAIQRGVSPIAARLEGDVMLAENNAGTVRDEGTDLPAHTGAIDLGSATELTIEQLQDAFNADLKHGSELNEAAREVAAALEEHADFRATIPLRDVLSRMIPYISTPGLRELVAQIAAIAPEIPVMSLNAYADITRQERYRSGEVSGVASTSGRVQTTDPRNNRFRAVAISTTSTMTGVTLLHEALHVVTKLALDRAREAGHATATAMDALFAHVKSLGFITNEAVLANVDEFIAYGLSQPSIRAALASVAVPEELRAMVPRARNLLQALVELVRTILNLSARQASALDVLTELTGQLMAQDATFRQQFGDPVYRVTRSGAIARVDQPGRTVKEFWSQHRKEDLDPDGSSSVLFARTRAINMNALNTSGTPGAATSQALTGITEDAAARPGGYTWALANQRGKGLWTTAREKILLPTMSMDAIRVYGQRLFLRAGAPGASLIRDLQNLQGERTATIARLMDGEIFTHYRGRDLTQLGFQKLYSEMVRQNPDIAHIMDELYAQSVAHQIRLDQPVSAQASVARQRQYARLEPVYRRLPQEWKDLYATTVEYFKTAREKSRNELLDRLQLEIGHAQGTGGSPSPAIMALDFRNAPIADLRTATGPGGLTPLLTTDQIERIAAIRAEFRALDPYLPGSRRGDWVVQGELDIDGEFAPADADRIKASFPDRRLKMEALPNGNFKLSIVANDPADPTDPAVVAASPRAQIAPLMIYERFENRADAENRIGELRNIGARSLGQPGARFNLTAKDVARAKFDPSRFDHTDPTLTPQAIQELERQIELLGGKHTATIERIVRNMIATMQPDTYISKGGIQRRFISGAPTDVLRAISEHMIALSNNLGHLRFDRQVEDKIGEMRKHAAQRYPIAQDTERADLVIREIEAREAAQFDRSQPGAFTNAVTGLSYFYMLTSPSYSVMQFMQPFMLTQPILGAKYGQRAAWRELRRAMGLVTRRALKEGIARTIPAAKGNLDIFDYEQVLRGALTGQPDEARLIAGIEEARDTGVLSLTASTDLYNAKSMPSEHRGERTPIQRMTKWAQRAMDVSRMLPHAIEVSNRAMSYIAAYRLEYAQTGDDTKARQAGIDAVRQSQIDYSRVNKPRWLMNNAWYARVGLQFKQYALHMYNLIMSNAMRSLDPKLSAEERWLAARTLAGVMATHGLVTGAAGIMFEPVRITVALLMMLGGGGEDRDWLNPGKNAALIDRFMHEGLRDIFGATLGEALYGGAPRLLGVDVTQRMGLQNLLTFGTLDDIERNKSVYEAVGRLLAGPAGSLVAGNIPDAFKHFADGNTRKGVEKLLPKAFRDIVRAFGLGSEGILDRNGNEVLGTSQLGAGDLLVQALGFNPSTSSNAYEAREAILTKKEWIESRTNALMQNYWKTRNDPAARAAVREDIQAFNRANPRARITSDRLAQSTRERARRERLARNNYGVPLSSTDRWLAGEAAYLR